MLQEHINAIVRHVQDQPDPASGAAVSTDASKQIQQLVQSVAQLRSAYLRQLWAEGWTLDQIAEVCGVTQSRIEQIVKR